MTPNKGDVIERIVRNKIGISELSRKLQVSRTAIYNWFETGQINLEMICKIGQIIDYDFRKEFPEEFSNAQNPNTKNLGSKKENQDEITTKAVDYWMNKYISLLERYNEMLVDLNYPGKKTSLSPINTEISDHFSMV
ncbi:hypothetical protein [Pedobacter gandavensis]|uniref:hypothetical protein n=1 Tax=Pedobacter gandavensis TaxID=2679963 RepID=UPI002931B8E5|nr:hypothetical protein [Pedobacter gandavensis]